MRATRRAARALTNGHLIEEKDAQEEELGGVPISLRMGGAPLSPSLPPRPQPTPPASPLPPPPPPPSSSSPPLTQPNGTSASVRARQILNAKNHSFDDEGEPELPPMMPTNSPDLPRLMNTAIHPMIWEVLVSTIVRPGVQDDGCRWRKGGGGGGKDAEHPGRSLEGPSIHKYVDVTVDGLSRYYAVLDENHDDAISVTELKEGFKRMLDEFGLFSPTQAFADAFDPVWQQFSHALHNALTHVQGSSMDDLTFDVFAYLVRRLKMEILLHQELFGEQSLLDRANEIAKKISDYSHQQSTGHTHLPWGHKNHFEANMLTVRDIELAEKKTQARANIICYSYNPRQLLIEELEGQKLRRFFLTNRDSRWNMRWIVVDGVDRVNILRLAVKYEIHPLYIEDVLELERQQPRFYKNGDHYFFIMPLLRLVNNSEEKFSADIPGAKRMKGIQIEKSHLAIFASGPPKFDTVITVQSPWKPVRSRCMSDLTPDTGSKKIQPKVGDVPKDKVLLSLYGVKDGFLNPLMGDENKASSFFFSKCEAESTSVDIKPKTEEEDDDDEPQEPQSVLSATAKAVEEEYSLLRRGNSNWLVHTLLHSSISMLVPLVDAYRGRVKHFKYKLEEQVLNFCYLGLDKQVLDLKMDLMWLHKRARKLKPVLANVLNDPKMDSDVLFYLQSVNDVLEMCVDDLSTMLSVVQSILEESEHVKDDDRNESLKIFTVVTTMFVPLQFLSGVYGMNFTYANNHKSPIPWMHDPHGFHYFWIMCLGMSIIFYCWLRFHKRWV